MRGLLLDSHAFLWFVGDDPRLPIKIKKMIEEPTTRLFLSAASAFEISIKHGLGKLPLDVPIQELLSDQLALNQIEMLGLTASHLAEYAALGFPNPNHRDPFDRILVAQARIEQLQLISGDQAFADYGVVTAW